LFGTSLTSFAQSHEKQLESQFQGVDFRFIGPGQAGGRISDLEVVPEDGFSIYISASTGGIFKSTDMCLSWTPLFDNAGSTLSIGDMDVADSNPRLIWAGTGEASGEQSSATVGDGVYKSIDAGKTWSNMGLEKTRHISRIRIDPKDPETVYVAATGARWGENSERGIYKTSDGGETWDNILFISNNTGFSDLVLHPNGKVLLASAWFQRRNAWAHVQTGSESGLYRSDDSGKTWKELDIFPDAPMGRIALWMAPSNPEVIYACVESKKRGLYKSEDAGLNWELVNDKQSTSYWYGRLYGDPVDENHIFVMGVNVNESRDGGKSYKKMPAKGVHVDHHIIWLNPENTDHRILANDGGLYLTSDSGNNWDFVSNLPIGQNYAISVDTKDVYTVYGGLQDNGVWGAPSQSASEYLVNNSDVIRICGGDGFYSASHPENNDIVLGESQYGFVVKRDLRTDSYKMIKPRSEKKDNHRFNWNSPFFISVHPPHKLYLGGNHVFKTEDLGENWKTISPDLSNNKDLTKEKVLGQNPVLKPYASVTALAESPIKPGFLLAGTDDGRLNISLDNGKKWEDISSKLDMPEDRFFTRVLWSVSDVGTAYVAAGRYYEANDLAPYLFKTRDFGKTWKKIVNGLSESAVIKGLAEHPSNPNLLFAGSHNNLYISINAGESWISPNWNLPPVAIDDIKLAFPHNDLVLGSYGRGIIILDNIDFLTEATSKTFHSKSHLFKPRAVSLKEIAVKNPEAGKYFWHAPDPASGLNLDYYINEKSIVRFEILDYSGNVLIVLQQKGLSGFNRLNIPRDKLKKEATYIKMYCNDSELIEKIHFKSE